MEMSTAVVGWKSKGVHAGLCTQYDDGAYAYITAKSRQDGGTFHEMPCHEATA